MGVKGAWKSCCLEVNVRILVTKSAETGAYRGVITFVGLKFSFFASMDREEFGRNYCWRPLKIALLCRFSVLMEILGMIFEDDICH